MFKKRRDCGLSRSEGQAQAVFAVAGRSKGLPAGLVRLSAPAPAAAQAMLWRRRQGPAFGRGLRAFISLPAEGFYKRRSLTSFAAAKAGRALYVRPGWRAGKLVRPASVAIQIFARPWCGFLRKGSAKFWPPCTPFPVPAAAPAGSSMSHQQSRGSGCSG